MFERIVGENVVDDGDQQLSDGVGNIRFDVFVQNVGVFVQKFIERVVQLFVVSEQIRKIYDKIRDLDV